MRLREGMTAREVSAILGQPTGELPGKKWWHGWKYCIDAAFDHDGKLTHKDLRFSEEYSRTWLRRFPGR